MRLIDADALKIPSTSVNMFENCRNCRLLDEEQVREIIDNAPTIDAVEVVYGEWICHEGKWIDFDYYPTKYECSQCHHYVDVASDKKFCPNCGAKMKGADDE